MAEDKNQTDVAEPTQEWVEEQCQKYEVCLAGFTSAMRIRFRDKARQGRGRWERPEFAQRLYQDMLAHAAAVPLAAGHEEHCANFLAFLWWQRTRNPGATAVSPAPRPLPFRGGYGLPADLELVRFTLALVSSDLTPQAVIDQMNREAEEGGRAVAAEPGTVAPESLAKA